MKHKLDHDNWHLISPTYHTLLEFLQAPPSLTGILDVAFIAKNCFEILARYDGLLPEDLMRSVPAIIDQIDQLITMDLPAIEDQYILCSQNKIPAGVRTKYPVYASFYAIHNFTHRTNKSVHNNVYIFAAICAIFTSWHYHQLDDGVINKATTATYDASINIRRLINTKNHLDITISTTYNQLITLISNPDEESAQYEGIERLLRLVSHYKGGRNRSCNTAIKSTIRSIHFTQDSEAEINEPTATITETCATDDKETQYNQQLITIAGTQHLAVAEQVYRHRAMVPRIRKNNQLLLSSKSVINDIDLFYLLAEIKKISTGSSEFQAHYLIPSAKFAVFLTILVWLGRSVPETLTLKYYQTEPKNLSDDTIYYIIDTDMFLVPAQNPEVGNLRQLHAAFLGTEQRVSHLTLINPVPTSKIMDTLAKDTGPKGHRIFNTRDQYYLQALQQFTQWMRQQYHTHLTSLRIQNIMYYEIAKNTQDPLLAFLITSQGKYESETSAHYFATSTTALSNIYKSTTEQLRCRIAPYFGVAEVATAQTVGTKELNIGSQITLQPDKVQLLTKHLKHLILAAKKMPVSKERTIASHNSLTLYTVMMFCYLTGCRPVNDVLENIKHIDWINNIIIISDKDNDAGYHTRRVPMAAVLRRQLSAYIDYLPTLSAITPALNVTVTSAISASHTTPFLFFLNKNMGIKHINPSSIRAMLPEYAIPDNSHRHYLETQLRSLKISAEQISSFAGHWKQGQEPDGKYSCSSPEAINQSLLVAINQLAKQDGWNFLTISGDLK